MICDQTKYVINGDLLRQLRRQAGISQFELAVDLCMQQSEISRLERMTGSKPRYDVLCMIADYFKKDINEFIIRCQ